MKQFLCLIIYSFASMISVIPMTDSFAATANNAQLENESNMFSVIDKFATFASVSYGEIADMQRMSMQRSYTLTDAGQLSGYEIRYLLATNDANKTQIIAIRGTANIENALINVSMNMNASNRIGIPLHDGFSQSAFAVFDALESELKSQYTISVTGHSLGGGVAVILAMYLDKENYNIGQVVTFGQPKVTNITGASAYSHLNVLRVVTPKDVVPLLPPFDPINIKNLDVYWHLGTEVILLGGDEYSMLGGADSMLRVTKFFNAEPSEENISNHHMSLYIRLVNQKRQRATLIPYKNNFKFIDNILNMFD